jgi:phosphohistidine phosphatase SixA
MSDKELENAAEQQPPIEIEHGKKLVIVRHGSYDSEGNLDNEGRKKIEELSRKINQLVNKDDSVLILSSPAPRAKESAKIIAEALKSPIEMNEILFTEYEDVDYREIEAAHNLIRSAIDKSSLLILVTHNPFISMLCLDIQAYDLQLKTQRSFSAGKGEGIFIDYEDKFIAKL